MNNEEDGPEVWVRRMDRTESGRVWSEMGLTMIPLGRLVGMHMMAATLWIQTDSVAAVVPGVE